jgi:hypothetical protein
MVFGLERRASRSLKEEANKFFPRRPAPPESDPR